MSLTSISAVRTHLFRLQAGEGEVRNQGVRLSSEAYAYLPHGHIVASSEQAKALENTVPCEEQVLLGDEPVALHFANPVTGTVVCAADSSLSQVYQENTDFSIDYMNGTIVPVAGGCLASGDEVTVWYLHYHLYQRDIDYDIDYQRGRIRRAASGSIEEGQEILVDYELGAIEYSDAEIEQCIAESEAEIGLLVDSAYRDAIDPALQTAATCLALAHLCRNSAGLMHAGDVPRDTSTWLQLAESYRETAMRLVSWYRPETPRFHPPRRT